METIEKTITNTPDLSWVTAAGGPEVLCEDGYHVTGLPEEGWRARPWRPGPTELRRHAQWVEPTTGFSGTLMVEIRPEDQGAAWDSLFMWYEDGDEEKVCIPVRGIGFAPDFTAAREAALAWRPVVQIIDGIELWTDPVSMRGAARCLRSGELTWRSCTETHSTGSLAWSYTPGGMKELDLFEWHSQSIRGVAESHEQMLDQVSAARDRLRSAIRNYLLSF